MPWYRCWASIPQADGRLTTRSHEISSRKIWCCNDRIALNFFQASRQRLRKSQPESLGFDASQDYVVQRPSSYWIDALVKLIFVSERDPDDNENDSDFRQNWRKLCSVRDEDARLVVLYVGLCWVLLPAAHSMAFHAVSTIFLWQLPVLACAM